MRPIADPVATLVPGASCWLCYVPISVESSRRQHRPACRIFYVRSHGNDRVTDYALVIGLRFRITVRDIGCRHRTSYSSHHARSHSRIPDITAIKTVDSSSIRPKSILRAQSHSLRFCRTATPVVVRNILARCAPLPVSIFRRTSPADSQCPDLSATELRAASELDFAFILSPHASHHPQCFPRLTPVCRGCESTRPGGERMPSHFSCTSLDSTPEPLHRAVAQRIRLRTGPLRRIPRRDANS